MMVMRSCSTCDTRWGERDGQAVDLPAVLTPVASTKRPMAATRR